MWRGLGGRLGGAARWERKWGGGRRLARDCLGRFSGGSATNPLWGCRGWPAGRRWADAFCAEVGDEGWGCEASRAEEREQALSDGWVRQ